jgi:tetratricopeptide (TPR) repeat protein
VDAERHLRIAVERQPLLSREPRLLVGGGDISVVIYSYASFVARALGRIEEAWQAGLAADRVRGSVTDPFSVAWALMVRGRGESLIGDYEAAAATAEEIIAICQKYGFRGRLGNGLTLRGHARAQLGDIERGIEDYRRGLGLWRGLGVVFHTSMWTSDFAEMLLSVGQSAEARTLLDDVDRLVEGTDDAAGLAECQRLRGMIAAADGDETAALRWFETAIATARHQGARLFELRAMTRLAELLLMQGQPSDAARRLGEIYGSFTEGHRAPDLRAAKAVLDRLSD